MPGIKLRAWVAAQAALVCALALAADVAAAAPCIAAKDECMHAVRLAANARALVYSTYPLDDVNGAVTRALVIVHGSGRDFGSYFQTGVTAASRANALANTIVVAPHFASNNGRSCRDALAGDEPNWTCSGTSWRAGGVAAGNGALTSFDFADEILRKLANKAVFPNLGLIVFAGHSAGGQFVARYLMTNQVHEQLGVRVNYVIASPSSYAYLDANRPASGNAASCAAYDDWPYGLQKRSGYAARLSEEQLKRQLAARPGTYLVGELDTRTNPGFDATCPAMAQGENRVVRTKAYTNYIRQNYGALVSFMIIPSCGHSARCMFTADNALPVLFPKQ